MVKRENLEVARALLEPVDRDPRRRADDARRPDRRARRARPPSLGDYSINILMPWLAASGRVAGLADGTFVACDPPPSVEEDEALATLARRYLAGYGPADADDLARWSGLPITKCRRALEAAGPLEPFGDLLALPEAADPAAAPPSAAANLLGAFDTAMLGWASREPIVAAAHDDRIGGGAGMIRAVVLVDGRARRHLEARRLGQAPAAHRRPLRRAAAAAAAGSSRSRACRRRPLPRPRPASSPPRLPHPMTPDRETAPADDLPARYDPRAVEAKWQRVWAEEKTWEAPNPGDPGFDPGLPEGVRPRHASLPLG